MVTGSMDRLGRPQPPVTGVHNAEVPGEAGFIADAIVLSGNRGYGCAVHRGNRNYDYGFGYRHTTRII
jgi:hypothetical protein